MTSPPRTPAMDKTPHELFMEAAAVETLAVAMASAGGRQWGNLRPDQQDQWRSAARRLITENMETRHDG